MKNLITEGYVNFICRNIYKNKVSLIRYLRVYRKLNTVLGFYCWAFNIHLIPDSLFFLTLIHIVNINMVCHFSTELGINLANPLHGN